MLIKTPDDACNFDLCALIVKMRCGVTKSMWCFLKYIVKMSYR
jgi:hypothetical protein